MDMEPAVRDLTSLGDPTRARILRLIRASSAGRMLVGQLADALGLRQPTVSHHMRLLREDGVVAGVRDGRQVWYSIEPAQANRVDALIGEAQTDAGDPDLERIARDLATRYRGTFSPETVRATVEASHALLAQSGQAPLLASRTASFAATRLDALRRVETPPDRPAVLFVCVQNAGRSQLAAGLLRQLAGDRVLVRTAGSAPAADVRATVIAALDEVGVALDGEFPKPLTDEAVRAADVVVTMGCGDACPIYPGRRYLDWDIDDPVGKPLATVRGIRDDIEARVRALLDELVA